MDTLPAVAGLALATLGWPALLLGFDRADVLPPRFTTRRLYTALGLQWLVAAVAAVWVVAVEGRPLASAGVRWVRPGVVGDPVVAFVAAGGLLLVGLLLLAGAEHLGLVKPDESTLFLSTRSLPTKTASAMTAGVTEEFLYRGYLIERVLDLTGSAALAVVLSVVTFTAMHLPNRPARSAVPGPLVLGIVFAVVYLLTRSLPLVVALHVAVDAIGLLSNDPGELLDRIGPESVDERVRAAVDGD